MENFADLVLSQAYLGAFWPSVLIYCCNALVHFCLVSYIQFFKNLEWNTNKSPHLSSALTSGASQRLIIPNQTILVNLKTSMCVLK